jgi:Xaa-Pro dipeptidase
MCCCTVVIIFGDCPRQLGYRVCAYNAAMPTRRRFLLSAAAAAPSLALSAQRRSNEPPPAPQPCVDTSLPAPVLALTDRRKEIVPITVSERETRLDRARALMKQNGLDAIVMTTGASLLYYTGAHWGQSERLFAYVIPRSAAPFVICPNLERDRVAELLTNFPEQETTLSYFWNENADPYELLRHALADYGVTTGSLGIEEHTQFAFVNAIAKACPTLTIASATPVTAGCRSIKSPAEIALLRLANHITLSVYRAVYLSCGPGDTNHRFSDLIDKAYERCGVRGEASLNVGIYSAVPHGSSQPQVIREGDVVMVDDGCTCDGYTSDITRSFVYGTPTAQQRSVFDVVLNAQSAALAAARPGVEMQAIDTAARSVIIEAGYGPGYDYFTHRVGHGIGLDMHEWPYLVQGNTQKLAPGMVFSDEPGVYLRGHFGIRLEDDMHITENGAEMFTPQSPSLQDPFAIPEPAKAVGKEPSGG